MTITDERKQVFDVSDPYYTSAITLATTKSSTLKSYDELKGKLLVLKKEQLHMTGCKKTKINTAIQSKLTLTVFTCLPHWLQETS